MKIKYLHVSLLVPFVFLLSACSLEPSEFISICTKKHTEIQMMPMASPGGGVSLRPMPVVVCDEKETRRNPDYDERLTNRQLKN